MVNSIHSPATPIVATEKCGKKDTLTRNHKYFNDIVILLTKAVTKPDKDAETRTRERQLASEIGRNFSPGITSAESIRAFSPRDRLLLLLGGDGDLCDSLLIVAETATHLRDALH